MGASGFACTQVMALHQIFAISLNTMSTTKCIFYTDTYGQAMDSWTVVQTSVRTRYWRALQLAVQVELMRSNPRA